MSGGSDPPQGLRTVAIGSAAGRRDRARPAGQPPGGVAASRCAQGGGSRGRQTGRNTARLHHRSARARRAARVARSVLGPGTGVVPRRSRTARHGRKPKEAMTRTLIIAPVGKRVVVRVNPVRAFEIFTGAIDAWWPKAYRIGATSPLKQLMIEPFTGGRWLIRCEDGSELRI